jgi:Beta-lactamase enzyme family
VTVRVAIVTLVLTLLVASVADAPRRTQAAQARPPAAAITMAPASEPRIVALGGIEEAQRWARRRPGTVSFAVARSSGRIRGVAIHRRHYSASVVKAMLALAVLRAARDRDLSASEGALLRPMITVSDNDAATAVYGQVGAGALYAVASRAGMRNFDVGGNWADAQITAYDQARLFLRIDRLTPKRHRGYFRDLLASIASYQRWGIAPVGEQRGFHVMFKGGWRPGIFHQAALLERGGRRVAIAVLTSGAGDADGRVTQAGVAERVLAPLPRRATSRTAR